jgi:general secretion pathway protein H
MRARGFTLIELLVVLVIIGMALTVVPTLLGSLPGSRLRAAADDMVATLRELRSQAVGSGRSTALVVDPASRSYDILPGGARHRLPDVVTTVEVTVAEVTTGDPLLARRAEVFRFFPDGTANGGVITLRHGNRFTIVTVEWPTGRVQLLK